MYLHRRLRYGSLLYSLLSGIFVFVFIIFRERLTIHRGRMRSPRPPSEGGGSAHDAIELYFFGLTACTRVHTALLNPYNCTGGVTLAAQLCWVGHVYTPSCPARTPV